MSRAEVGAHGDNQPQRPEWWAWITLANVQQALVKLTQPHPRNDVFLRNPAIGDFTLPANMTAGATAYIRVPAAEVVAAGFIALDLVAQPREWAKAVDELAGEGFRFYQHGPHGEHIPRLRNAANRVVQAAHEELRGHGESGYAGDFYQKYSKAP